eukprot:GFUD01016281.1.p1 GENE.GFUD01016281.1~~GFUD01016281.1.p1  ORF type:complete len:303 (-),score=85.92 GFUD01016281.1:47-922(-)
METGVPDVFDVFGLGNSYVPSTTPQGGIALPGLVTRVEDKQYSWTPRLNKQNSKWREGRSPCERPRTYDKFYQKTPGNFQEPQTDSAVSLCSSENEEQRVAMEKDKKKKRGRRSSDKNLAKDNRNSKTLTEQDIKHIERHLSMKRTIRKKIMRDLQQAFVKDPTGQMAVEKDNMMNVLGQSEPNILDMLRDSQDSGNVSPVREQKFRSCRVRRRKSSYFDSSSEELSNIFGGCDTIDSTGVVAINGNKLKINNLSLIEPAPDYEESPAIPPLGKKTFWQRLVGRKQEKRKQ